MVPGITAPGPCAKYMVGGPAQGFSEGGKKASGQMREQDKIRSGSTSAERDAEQSQGAGESGEVREEHANQRTLRARD